MLFVKVFLPYFAVLWQACVPHHTRAKSLVLWVSITGIVGDWEGERGGKKKYVGD